MACWFLELFKRWWWSPVRRQVVPQRDGEAMGKGPIAIMRLCSNEQEGEDVARPTEVVLCVSRYKLNLEYTRGLIRAQIGMWWARFWRQCAEKSSWQIIIENCCRIQGQGNNNFKAKTNKITTKTTTATKNTHYDTVWIRVQIMSQMWLESDLSLRKG